MSFRTNEALTTGRIALIKCESKYFISLYLKVGPNRGYMIAINIQSSYININPCDKQSGSALSQQETC